MNLKATREKIQSLILLLLGNVCFVVLFAFLTYVRLFSFLFQFSRSIEALSYSFDLPSVVIFIILSIIVLYILMPTEIKTGLYKRKIIITSVLYSLFILVPHYLSNFKEFVWLGPFSWSYIILFILVPLIIIYLVVSFLFWLLFSERKSMTNISFSRLELFFALDKYPKRIFFIPLLAPFVILGLAWALLVWGFSDCSDAPCIFILIVPFVIAFICFIFFLRFSMTWHDSHTVKSRSENNQLDNKQS